MEHIVQFGISIDDEKIKQTIEAQALDKVVEQINKEIKSSLPTTYTYKDGRVVDWSGLAESALYDFVEKHRDEITEAVIKKLFASVRNSKKFKEAFGTAIEELIGEAND